MSSTLQPESGGLLDRLVPGWPSLALDEIETRLAGQADDVRIQLVEEAADFQSAFDQAEEIDSGPDATRPEDDFAITVYSARELANLELPAPADEIAGPFLRRGMATLLGGLTGHGKTTIIARLVKLACDGGELAGHTAPGGSNVLVLDLEQHLHTIQRVIREAGLDESALVDYAPIPEGLALNKRSDQLDRLDEILAAKAYDVLVVDPFYKIHEADSSDELAARMLVALFRGWIKTHGFAILTATHCRKLPAGRTVITIDDLFGSSLFTRDPELVLGIQRHNELTKLHVFKSREPGLDHGQVFELLYNRERGYWLKPTVDPEERSARLNEVAALAIEWIRVTPGQSTNQVKKAVSALAKCGSDLVEEALMAQVKSGLHPAPVAGSRRGKYWYPHNHAALTSPETLLGEVTDSAHNGQTGDDFTRPSDFYVVEGRSAGEVDEAAP